MNYYNSFFAAAFFGLSASHCAADVQVKNAWVQLAPPSAVVNAAYMTIHNSQTQSQTIVGVSADCCAMAMLHQSRKAGDRVQMDHLDQLVVPEQTSIHLSPGGMHIMLMQAKTALTLDSIVKITLSFSDGSKQEIDLRVKRNDA